MLTPTWKAPFQFTPLREGRHILSRLAEYYGVFQFTPLREGRRQVRYELIPTQRISIHAPPRGATVQAVPAELSLVISIHAPPRGATSGIVTLRGITNDFNSRPSARGDSSSFVVLDCNLCISIHAPPRGATLNDAADALALRYFNSRPSARGDARALRSVSV